MSLPGLMVLWEGWENEGKYNKYDLNIKLQLKFALLIF